MLLYLYNLFLQEAYVKKDVTFKSSARQKVRSYPGRRYFLEIYILILARDYSRTRASSKGQVTDMLEYFREFSLIVALFCCLGCHTTTYSIR